MKSGSKELQQIPGIGPKMAKSLNDLGVHKISHLRRKNPESLYRRLCEMRGRHIDRCVLYVFRCAVYYASNEKHAPRLLQWWSWQDKN